jgi:lipoprotein NlpI
MRHLIPHLLAAILFISSGLAMSAAAAPGPVTGCDQQISRNFTAPFISLVAASPNPSDAPPELDATARHARAMALIQQGNTLDNRGQSAPAIAAYTEAIRLGAVGEAMAERGIAYAKMDRYGDALADLNEAVRLLPDAPGAYANRAFVCFDLGRFQATARDMATALRFRPGAPYYVLLRYLALRHLGEPAHEELLEYASTRTLARWPGPVIALYLGMLDPDGLRQAVIRIGSLQARCEASFYVGEYELLRGNTESARVAFEQIRANKPCIGFTEDLNARGELRRMGVPVQ